MIKAKLSFQIIYNQSIDKLEVNKDLDEDKKNKDFKQKYNK